MSGRDVVIEFTRGIMDRIRDHIKVNFPNTHSEIEAVKTELTEKTLKSGDRVSYAREIKEENLS